MGLENKRTGTPAEPSPGAWHTLDVPSVFRAVEAGENGLTSAEARARLERFGPNELPQQPPPAWWMILLRQFNSPLIYVLAAAALVSLGVGLVKDPGLITDAAFIGVVLAINSLIGGYQEWKAEQSSRALQQLLQIRATVVRDGEARELEADGVVPGDIVWLESGNRVPADLRLISAHGLEVDESLLTGESLAVGKDPSWTGEEGRPVADRRNLAWAGSIVVRGRGKGVVVTTGTRTMVGQLALDVLGTTGGRPPLLERMERFARAVVIAVGVSVALLGVLGVVVHRYSVLEMFMFGIALAVSAIPEGLPAALTVALAIATTRMARRGVIVRRLAAVEGLGSCTLIASDKTGTLTCNELTVRLLVLPGGERLDVTGEGFAPLGEVRRNGEAVQAGEGSPLEPLARAAVLCNEGDLHLRDGAWVWRGDPTDLALLAVAHKLGWQREAALDQYPQVNEIPFEPEHRFAATYHRMDAPPESRSRLPGGTDRPTDDEPESGPARQAGPTARASGRLRVVVKGAPERVLAMCSWPGGRAPQEFHDEAESLAAEGYRILALAEGDAPDDLGEEHVPPEPGGLTFLGFAAMIDPLRPGVREAVAACRDAGITVCMVTGDHPVTALAIARDLGLADVPDQVVSGRELEGKSSQDMQQLLRHTRVFARVAPRQKLELVEAARGAGHFVAVTGDGVNDAPALRAANIGVAMGKAGTDVAREAAELVISDDNFATIVAGVEEGRVAFDNVRKVIYLLVSTGAAEVLLIGIALLAGTLLPLPLLPVQLLWLNLVTNGIQGVALAFEPSEGDVLLRRPRPPREPIFNRLMIERTVVAALVMSVVGVAAFWWLVPPAGAENYDQQVASARNALLLLMVLFENIHIGNCRSETKSALRLSPFRSPILLAGALGALAVHVAGMYVPPLKRVLKTEPVDLRMWLVLVGLALTVFVAMELHKWTWRVRHPEDLPRGA
ncbi:MAG TPA: HAD-IC family P-type ATPase [Planctomycetaceae bacterium]|nr:HAD-IC family P-type ATPase [Planctomycetaceae bacterium]